MAKVVHEQKCQLWVKRLKERKELGITVKEYCRRKGYSSKLYYHWQKVLRDENISMKQITKFVELPEVVCTSISSNAVLHIGSASIELVESMSDEFLQRLIKAAAHA